MCVGLVGGKNRLFDPISHKKITYHDVSVHVPPCQMQETNWYNFLIFAYEFKLFLTGMYEYVQHCHM